jgi:hypothetical protein
VLFNGDNAAVWQVKQLSIKIKLKKSRLVYDDILLGYEIMYLGINVSTLHRNVLPLS